MSGFTLIWFGKLSHQINDMVGYKVNRFKKKKQKKKTVISPVQIIQQEFLHWYLSAGMALSVTSGWYLESLFRLSQLAVLIGIALAI